MNLMCFLLRAGCWYKFRDLIWFQFLLVSAGGTFSTLTSWQWSSVLNTLFATRSHRRTWWNVGMFKVCLYYWFTWQHVITSQQAPPHFWTPATLNRKISVEWFKAMKMLQAGSVFPKLQVDQTLTTPTWDVVMASLVDF